MTKFKLPYIDMHIAKDVFTPGIYSMKMQIFVLVRLVPKYNTIRSCFSFLNISISFSKDSTSY